MTPYTNKTFPVKAMSPGKVNVSAPTAMGLIRQSKQAVGGTSGIFTNMATSWGFPWTTGMITLSDAAAAATPELFTITGKDGRVGGVGTLSLVSGALSNRTLSKGNSNRSWVQYNIAPEPGAVLGAGGALAMLAICHAIVRRRSR